jgi:hypothetical protein
LLLLLLLSYLRGASLTLPEPIKSRGLEDHPFFCRAVVFDADKTTTQRTKTTANDRCTIVEKLCCPSCY